MADTFHCSSTESRATPLAQAETSLWPTAATDALNLSFGSDAVSYGEALRDVMSVALDAWPPLMSERAFPGRTLDQQLALIQKIDLAIEFIQQKRFADAVLLLHDTRDAREIGIEVIIHPYSFMECPTQGEISSINFNGIRENSYRSPGRSLLKQGVPIEEVKVMGEIHMQRYCVENFDTKKENGLGFDDLVHRMAYTALEEWMHAAQEALGSPLSKGVQGLLREMQIEDPFRVRDEVALSCGYEGRFAGLKNWIRKFKWDLVAERTLYEFARDPLEPTALEMANKYGAHLTKKQWRACLAKAFHKVREPIEAGFADRVSFKDVIFEMDIVQTWNERSIPVPSDHYFNHNRIFFFDYNPAW